MTIARTLLVALAFGIAVTGCDQQNEKSATPDSETGTLDTREQKLSYIMGQNIGGQFANQDIPIEMDALTLGLRDAIEGAEPRLGEEEVGEILTAFREEQMAKQQAAMEAEASENEAAGTAFMTENSEKEGVVTLESGLQYKVLEEGSGASPASGDTVEVHYKGTLLDGTEFDSSYRRGVPATFGVTQVIPGWTEALQLMKEGGKWELYIPPELAYGPGGSGPIGPNSTLVFEVELLKVVKGEE